MNTVDGTSAAAAAPAASVEAGTQLGFLELRSANLRRAREWNPTGKDLGGPFAACELAGEVGEAIEAMGAALGLALATGSICNATKKAERAAAGIAGGVADLVDLSRELADVVICADLVAMRLGVDLGAAVVEKFNLTSRERGFATKLVGWSDVSRCAARVGESLALAQRDALLETINFLSRWLEARHRLEATLQSQYDADREQIVSRLNRQYEAAEQPWKVEEQQFDERLRSLGIVTERRCIRDEQPAQPATAGGAT